MNLDNIPQEVMQKAENVANQYKVAIFIVAYNAANHIESTIQRIPEWLREKLYEVFVIDDSSSDNTVNVLQGIQKSYSCLSIFQTPHNQGYGGNQKLGYSYAIDKQYDIVVLLHGDGQYAPEFLPYILAEYEDKNIDAVFGSRFLGDPLKGSRGGKGMPLYKYVGNKILTSFSNFILKTSMSEMHSGYRSYRVSALKAVPFQKNCNDFSFDADIIIQMVAAKKNIKEIPIPTFYGDEICYVNGMKYALQCCKTALKYLFMQVELFYDPKFDIENPNERKYIVKEDKLSIHHKARNLSITRGSQILDIGGGDGAAISKAYVEQGCQVTVIDNDLLPPQDGINKVYHGLNENWESAIKGNKYDVVFAFDVLEHLLKPEQNLEKIHSVLNNSGKLYASTSNVAFCVIRFLLLFGKFNYSRRGILDLSHTRLFTRKSFKRLIENHGFKVVKKHYFGPPIGDINNKSMILKVLNKAAHLLANCLPNFFAFQVFYECERIDSLLEIKQQIFVDNEK